MAPTACRHTGSGSISLPCAGCFSPFPHGTRPLSVSREYLALADGPAGFTQDSSCPALLRITIGSDRLRAWGCHPLRRRFPTRSRSPVLLHDLLLLPLTRRNAAGLGFSPVARHYWGNHSCFLLLRVLRCFSSPGSPPPLADDRPSDGRVVPFGYPRITGHLHLHAAFRSLSRPSSPPRAQASTVCP